MSEHAEMQVEAGENIYHAAKRATQAARLLRGAVRFEFNGAPVIARAGDSVETVVDLWSARREAIARGWRP